MGKKTHINFWYVTGAILLMLWIQSLYLDHQIYSDPVQPFSDPAERGQSR
jgi:hypothetical protein